MALSPHFTPSTQDILTAQQSQSPHRSRAPPRGPSPNDRPIIVISSSSDERPFSHLNTIPLENPSGDESDPFEQWAPLPRPEESGKISDNEDLAQLLGTYKYETKQPLKESVKIPHPTAHTTRKTSLDTFFQECKPVTRTGKNRVKTTLTSRVALPKPKLTPTVATSTPNNSAARQQSSFFTTWAAAQAPATRSARATSRKKPTRTKKNETEVVLLSPQSGKKSVRKRAKEKVDMDRRLGEKRDSSAGSMWDASNRGLEGELYDVDGSMIFSQELRLKCTEISPEVALQEVGMDVEVEVGSVETLTETTTAVIDDGIPARRRGVDVESLEDGMPPYSTFTVQQLQNEVKKFGFKASKSKPGMISILEDCWKATQQPVKQPDLPPETPVPPSVPIDLSSPAILRRVQARIFQTIKADPDQGVYCGILRYEPVVIEELVVWLKDRGVDVPELVVRGWCDKEGICCVGAESLRTGRRARY